MTFNIEGFKANGLKFGGARPSLFEVILTEWPGSTAGAEQQFRFLAKTSQLPPSLLGQVEVPYFSRKIRVMGDRQYANWTVSVMNDEDFEIRTALETWHQSMNMHIENVTNGVTSAPITYKRDGIIKQYGKDGFVLKQYTFKGLFPTQIDAIPLGWELTDQVEVFDVDFSIDYWLPYDDVGVGEAGFFSDQARSILNSVL
jgi:hypothetical protein